jgi:hypothetical protein
MDKKNGFKELQDIIDKLTEISKKLKDQIDRNKKQEPEKEEAVILPFKKKE